MAGHLHARAPRGGDVRRRLAGLPGRARRAARAPGPGRLVAVGPPGHPRGLGPRHGPLRVPRRGARRGRDDRRAPARRARRRPALDPGVRRGELRRAPAAALARAGRRRCPCPGKLGIGEHELELIPADGHTHDGMAIWVPWARVLLGRRLPAPGRDPVAAGAGQPQRLPGDARPAQAATSSRPTGSSPGTARRSTPPARWRSCARTSPTSQALPARRTRRCRSRGAAPASGGSTPTTSRRSAGAGVIQHVALETRPADVEGELGFWALLGFEPVDPPGDLGDRSAWVQRAGTQVHLLFADEPVVAAAGPRRRRAPTTTPRRWRAWRAPASRWSRARGTGARRAPSCARRPATASSSWPPRRSPDLDAPVAGARLEDRLGVGRRSPLDGAVLQREPAPRARGTRRSRRRGGPRAAGRRGARSGRPGRAGGRRGG